MNHFVCCDRRAWETEADLLSWKSQRSRLEVFGRSLGACVGERVNLLVVAFYGYAGVWTVASRKLLKERVFVPISMSNRRKRKETSAGPRLISREREECVRSGGRCCI